MIKLLKLNDPNLEDLLCKEGEKLKTTIIENESFQKLFSRLSKICENDDMKIYTDIVYKLGEPRFYGFEETELYSPIVLTLRMLQRGGINSGFGECVFDEVIIYNTGNSSRDYSLMYVLSEQSKYSKEIKDAIELLVTNIHTRF